MGPRIEYSIGDIFEDDEVAQILPFLALPDGAHLVTLPAVYLDSSSHYCRARKTILISISSSPV